MAPTTKGLVLVTGANGYIAARVVEAFLEAGYSVRGTVRSEASGKGLLEALPTYAADGRLELALVPDIVKEGAFDEAVKDVLAIAHLASPVSLFFTDPDYVINTAVGATRSVLGSAAKSPSVKHFVLMSSITAVTGAKQADADGRVVFTEADWNDQAEGLVASLGAKAPGGVIYSASKVAAEKAFWDFGKAASPAFTMAAVNPVFVIGPPLVLPQDPAKIGETTEFIWQVFSGQDIPGPLAGFGAYVDVRDVARLVLFAAVGKPDEANGERYIAAAHYANPQAAADILRKAYPDRRDVIKEGKPGDGYEKDYAWPTQRTYDGSKGEKALGRSYLSFERSILDAAKDFEIYLK